MDRHSKRRCARQAEFRSLHAPLAFSQSLYGQSKKNFFPQIFGLSQSKKKEKKKKKKEKGESNGGCVSGPKNELLLAGKFQNLENSFLQE